MLILMPRSSPKPLIKEYTLFALNNVLDTKDHYLIMVLVSRNVPYVPLLFRIMILSTKEYTLIIHNTDPS